MARRIKDLLELLGGDAEQEVQRAFSRWNKPIRDAIRSVTGLKFSEFGDGPTASVPITVVKGYPMPLRDLLKEEIPPDEWAAELIGSWQHRINELEKNSRELPELLNLLKIIPGWETKTSQYLNDINRVQTHCDELLHYASKSRLRDLIQRVDEDILSAYFYREEITLLGPHVSSTRIELYWIVIGTVARYLGVSVQALTVVVLCHELAHAYTHVGRDIDGLSWQSIFGEADKEFKEGIAQYYTHLSPRNFRTSILSSITLIRNCSSFKWVHTVATSHG